MPIEEEGKGREMSLVSWARKEFDRLRFHKPKSLLLLPPTPPVKEVVIAADLHCTKCQMRIADAISMMDGGMESMVVHVLEKKVTFASSKASRYE